MPSPAPRCAYAPVVQRVGDCPERGRTRRLNLAHDGQHVRGERVRCLSIYRYALGLCFGQVGPVPQHCGRARRCGHRSAWGPPAAVLCSLLPAAVRGIGCPLWPWCYSGGRTTPRTGRQLGRPPSRQWARTCRLRCKKIGHKARHAAPTAIGYPQCSLRGNGCDGANLSRGLAARQRPFSRVQASRDLPVKQ
jgi:hypothetical protein